MRSDKPGICPDCGDTHYRTESCAPDPTPKLTAVERPAKYGTCCACGCEDDEEVVCPIRKDGVHCVHYWDVRLADE